MDWSNDESLSLILITVYAHIVKPGTNTKYSVCYNHNVQLYTYLSLDMRYCGVSLYVYLYSMHSFVAFVILIAVC